MLQVFLMGKWAGNIREGFLEGSCKIRGNGHGKCQRPISGVLGKQSAGLLGGWGRNQEGFLESDPGRPIPTKEGDTDPEVC